MRGLIPVARVTSSFVVTTILPLLRAGLIDRKGCVLLGGVVGIVVALRSVQFRSDGPANET